MWNNNAELVKQNDTLKVGGNEHCTAPRDGMKPKLNYLAGAMLAVHSARPSCADSGRMQINMM